MTGHLRPPNREIRERGGSKKRKRNRHSGKNGEFRLPRDWLSRSAMNMQISKIVSNDCSLKGTALKKRKKKKKG